VRAESLVRECWMLSGEVDFILKCVAPDMATFQDFVTHLTAAPHVRNVRTSMVLHNSKYEAAVPLELKVPGGISPAHQPRNTRHKFVMAGLCPGHPRLSSHERCKTWMPGTRPGMTNSGVADVALYQLFLRTIVSRLYGPPPAVAR